MLKRFSVTNFKNFKETITFDLGQHANYEFNNEVISGNCLTKGIVCGINGSGKSNLALALFDIVLHLTDKQKNLDKYIPYLNLDSKKQVADFEYVFEFDGVEVLYRYSKLDALTLTHETLLIDGSEVLSYDFETRQGYTNLKGAETLQLSSDITAESNKISRVKIIKSNALLQDNRENRAFGEFTTFVDNMLMFYSLDQNRYQGFSVGVDSYTQGIIREGKISEFQEFLKKHGVNYTLVEGLYNGLSDLFCKFENSSVPFTLVASTGTKSLALFYYWYIQMAKASFVFVDEFDAFYHFELAQALVELVKGLKNVQVFFSTHNTDLYSNDLLRPDAYFRIKNNSILSFDRATSKELRKAHNIQKMYKAGSFDE